MSEMTSDLTRNVTKIFIGNKGVLGCDLPYGKEAGSWSWLFTSI